MSSQTYLTLPSGQKLPALGLGTMQATNEKEVETALDTALELGYRHIDTAWIYQNEVAIGKVLKKWISSGKIKREELFITTKLPMIGIHQDRVDMFIKRSLENLQLDYVDLYLVHFPVGFKYKKGIVRPYKSENGDFAMEGKTDHEAIWRKMEEQVDAGRAKNIGLSNYSISQIQTVLNCARIKPANLQLELHVFFQQREIVDFCHKNGMTVVGYAPLGNPDFNKMLEKHGMLKKEGVPDILGDPTIAKLAEKYNKTPAQIALKYLLQIGVSAIPKSSNPKRIKENFSLFDFTLSKEDMKVLYDLDAGEKGRIFDFKMMTGLANHPDYPLKH